MASNQSEEDDTCEDTCETTVVVIQVIFNGIISNEKLSFNERKTYKKKLFDFIPITTVTEKERIDKICTAVTEALQEMFTDEKREIVSSKYLDDIGFEYYYKVLEEEEARMILFRAFVSARGTSSLNWAKVLTMLAIIQAVAYRISGVRNIQAVAVLASHSLEFFTEHGVHNWISNQGSGWEYLIDLPFAMCINPRLPTLEERQFSKSWVPEDDFIPRERLPSVNTAFREYVRIRPSSESGPERAGCSYKYDLKKRPVPPVRPPTPDSLSPHPPSRKETKSLGEEKFYRTTTVIVEVMMACFHRLMDCLQSFRHNKFLTSLENINTELPTSEKSEMDQIVGCIHSSLRRVNASDTFIPAVLEFYTNLGTKFQRNRNDQTKARLFVFRALISAHTSGTLSWAKVFLMLAIIQKLTFQISIDQPAGIVRSLADFCIEFFRVHGVHEWIEKFGGGWKYLTTVNVAEKFKPILPGRKEMKFASKWNPDVTGSPAKSSSQSKQLMKNPPVFCGEEKFYRTTTVIVEVMMACLRRLMDCLRSLSHNKFLNSLENINTELPTSEKSEIHQIVGCIDGVLRRVNGSDTFTPAVFDFYNNLSTKFQSNRNDQTKARLFVFRALISAHTSGTLSWEKVVLMLAIIQKLTLHISIDQPADIVQSLAEFCIEFFCVHGVHEWVDTVGGGWKYLTTEKITEDFIPILPGKKEMKFASNWKPEDPGSPVESRAQSKRPMKNPSVSKAKGEKSKASSGKLSFFTSTEEKPSGGRYGHRGSSTI